MDIEKIVSSLGGKSAVGALCGVTRQAVAQWRIVPTEYVLLIASHSEFSPHDIRPDVYPHPDDGMRGMAARRRANRKSSDAAAP